MRSLRDILELKQHNLKIPDNQKNGQFTDELRNTGDLERQDLEWAKERGWGKRILQHIT